MEVSRFIIDQPAKVEKKSKLGNQFKLTVPDIFKVAQLPSLNGFRAVSILMVLYSHAVGSIYGGLGVEIFFVISGLLITTLLLKEKIKTGDINLKSFYLRRAIRILPVAYLFILVAIVINYTFKPQVPFYHFILAFFFLTNLVGGVSIIGHYWSLSMEEQFYLIFPYFIKKSLKTYVIFLSILLVFVNLLYFLNVSPYQFPRSAPMHYFMYLLIPVRHLDGIIIGSFTSLILFRYNLNLKHLLKYKYILHILVVPLIVYLYNSNISIDTFKYPNPINRVIIVILIAFLIALNLIQSNDLIFKLLNNKWFARLGVLSYSLYIWQQIFTRNIPWIHSFKYSDSILLNLIGLAIVSGLSYYCYEKQFLKLKARIKA